MKNVIIIFFGVISAVIVVFITTGIPAAFAGFIIYLIAVKVFGLAPMGWVTYWAAGWLLLLAVRTLK